MQHLLSILLMDMAVVALSVLYMHTVLTGCLCYILNGIPAVNITNGHGCGCIECFIHAYSTYTLPMLHFKWYSYRTSILVK